MANRFSNAEKAQELRRELGMRRHVYPRRVAEGKLKQDVCDRQIAMLEEMLREYEALDARDRPDMFAPGPTLFDEAQQLEREVIEGNRESVAERSYSREMIEETSIHGLPQRSFRPGPPQYDHEHPAPPRDPTFGKTPGVEIEREGQRFGTCKCGESTLTGQVKDVSTGTLNWRVFDALPIEHNGFRYYDRHRCDHPSRRRRG